ncbi:transcriptional modulator of MazE/toxin, MazF [Stanieria cyanosphaera PCC 7437]|uniref:mRNA interferase n=1 Tax=Stanieria cyanosphaera (strain ATCC 29371 / PCC 7437) TaxID=111780 RepID=K9XTP6_STAC7|nr:type II toxin-antitoxin system PemK/MazF family toxin [Stanieria cyanosphaera]AFZ35913.1 transcriptional modulator of MazE/toxin, MazF [Stanieria cyanosphaera PCC 7437]
MVIEQGEIYWVDLGKPKASEPGYCRPCVVVQNNIFNQSKIATVAVCMITSNLKRANSPGNVFLAQGEANLSKASVVNISQILTVNKSALQQKIGNLTTEKLNLVIAGIKLLIEPR